MQTYQGIWRKRQFVPSWVIQCLVSGFFVVVACLALWAASLQPGKYGFVGDVDDYGIWADESTRNWLIGEAVYILLLSLFTIAADVVEAALFHRRHLSPAAVLVLAVIKTAGWLVYLIVAAVATAAAVSAVLDIILGLLMVVTALVQLFYGAKFTHRQRKGLLSQQVGGGNKTGDAEYGMNHYNQTHTGY
ncbi:hypothetical protein PG993_009233 [Apiospora rasikravindrae]|uniref:Uncharacterized protein n=1 Tax=Apiospora rasikravindrae TaxID=990691 RepID=A0ABR1SIU6_9PEZI